MKKWIVRVGLVVAAVALVVGGIWMWQNNGKHTITGPDGVYSGTLLFGRRHGHGKWVSADGSWSFDGTWDMGFPDEGVMTYENGRVFEGKCNDFSPESGRMTYVDGGCYEGEFLYTDRCGTGRMVYSDGTCYEGAWKKDLPNGQGTYIDEMGNIYSGIWEDGYLETESGWVDLFDKG